MKTILITLLTIITPLVSAANDDIAPYISPGVRIGWNFKKVITFDCKCSFGIAGNSRFYNITGGFRNAIFNFSSTNFDKYFHLDINMGKTGGIPLFEIENSLMYGGGIGIGFNQYDIFPCMTIFTGFGLFTSIDMFYSKSRGFNTDLGFQGVLPIPIVDDFGSPGG